MLLAIGDVYRDEVEVNMAVDGSQDIHCFPEGEANK